MLVGLFVHSFCQVHVLFCLQLWRRLDGQQKVRHQIDLKFVDLIFRLPIKLLKQRKFAYMYLSSKFECFPIYIYTELFFSRRSIQSLKWPRPSSPLKGICTVVVSYVKRMLVYLPEFFKIFVCENVFLFESGYFKVRHGLASDAPLVTRTTEESHYVTAYDVIRREVHLYRWTVSHVCWFLCGERGEFLKEIRSLYLSEKINL